MTIVFQLDKINYVDGIIRVISIFLLHLYQVSGNDVAETTIYHFGDDNDLDDDEKRFQMICPLTYLML